MKTKKIVLSAVAVFVVVVLVGALLTVRLLHRDEVQAADLSPALSENRGVTLDLTGKVDSLNKVAVYPDADAPITRVLVAAGDRVQEGQLLVTLDASKLQIEAESKAAEVHARQLEGQAEQRRAQEHFAQLSKEVGEGTHPELVASSRAVRDAEAAAAAAEAEAKATESVGGPTAAEARQRVSQAQRALGDAQLNAQLTAEKLRYEVAQAEKNANDTAAINSARQAQASTELQKVQVTGDTGEVRAPFDGVVGEVLATAGQPTAGALLTLIDDSAVVINTSVRDVDVAAVRPGMQARFTTSVTGGREFSGAVAQVSPVSATSISEASTARPYFPVQIAPDGDTLPLRVGALATIELIIEEPSAEADPNVLLVPAGAVLDNTVLVLGEGQIVEKREVATLTTQGARIEVRGDLRAGEQVLENPHRYAGLVGKTVTIHGN